MQTVASLAVVPVEVEASFRNNPASDDITNVVLLKHLVGDVGGTHLKIYVLQLVPKRKVQGCHFVRDTMKPRV